MLLRIISAEGEVYNGKISQINFPTPEWRIGILPWHINLVTPLVSGSISYITQEDHPSSLESFIEHTKTIDTNGWLAMVEHDTITIAIE